MKKYLLVMTLLGTSAMATPRKVYPLQAETIAGGAYDYSLNFLYSKTLSFYDVDGNETELEELQDYTLMDTDLKLKYGYSRKLELIAGAKFRQVSSGRDDGSGSGVTDTTSGIENVNIGFKYAWKKNKNYRYAISGSYVYRPYEENVIYTNSSQIPEGEIVLGDSGQEFNIGFHLDYIYSKWTTIEASAGYRSAPNDLAPEVPYHLALVKNYNTWALWGGVKGIYSLGGDPYTDNPSDKPLNATGTTARWNSINRSYMQPYGGVRFLIKKKYRLSFEAAQTMSGTSTDKVGEFSANLAWTSGGKSKDEIFEESFKEYTTEATIIKVSPRGKFVKIDKGLAQDVAKGAKVDIYKTDYFGGNILIASGLVYESGPSWAIIKLVKKFRSVPIEKGLTARVK
ncbi:hypothetical protein [Bacteriovorax sp. DB6_IX]|uniref:hypothetical protein n=1 Tax=Bacteriovorax sp. DB6_IX TaxID=1353530 RepID=UPI000389F1A8|nr:hypothetical protein [Bacteriovorax sp. DB6_IX]EQC50544.1 hypothetical protein M901_2508 [Bacteriovorax sp. DB6_IX]